jgi:hypothetical protein
MRIFIIKLLIKILYPGAKNISIVWNNGLKVNSYL